MSMSPEKATALRKPFPPESVGKLPKGGAMLDFVGHAAVTDRLLTVDPEWSWEPFALDANGLPAVVGGNLWIKLTVCGVTRIGVGDGKNAKECIGDAIRNAAMRFGVALDLWAKENLVEFAQAARHPAIEAGPVVTPPDVTPEHEDDDLLNSLEAAVARDANSMSPKTRATMFALFSDQGITDADAQRQGISRIVGREVESRGTLTEPEAKAVIATLRSRAKTGASS